MLLAILHETVADLESVSESIVNIGTRNKLIVELLKYRTKLSYKNGLIYMVRIATL